MTNVIPHPMSNVGLHDFPEMPEVNLTACIDGYRIWVRGVRYADFNTLSNAVRAMTALQTLASLDLLNTVRTPQETVRAMLKASLAEYPEGAA